MEVVQNISEIMRMSEAIPTEFATAFFDSAIQSPYNCLTKIAKGGNLQLPELHLVSKSNTDTIGSELGSFAGVATDVLVLSRLIGFRSKIGSSAISDKFTVNKLETAFGTPLTKVRLRWDLLQKMDAPVSTHVIVDREKLKDLYHPWYNSPLGKIVGWDSVDAKPLSVLDVAKKSAVISEERIAHINEVGGILKSYDSPVQITALAYKVPGNKHLLLDSNHRVAALAAENVPFRLIVHSINGPVSGKYLPDLVQFAPETAHSAAARLQAINETKKLNGW
jgi:hypothetical protein